MRMLIFEQLENQGIDLDIFTPNMWGSCWIKIPHSPSILTKFSVLYFPPITLIFVGFDVADAEVCCLDPSFLTRMLIPVAVRNVSS